MLRLSSPAYVIGDIHGNMADLRFFAENLWTFGLPLTAGTFLFLGDYVDRGLEGLETVAYLFALKVCVCVWMCACACGCVWLCVAVCGCVWLCIALAVCDSLSLCGCVACVSRWLCVRVSGLALVLCCNTSHSVTKHLPSPLCVCVPPRPPTVGVSHQDVHAAWESRVAACERVGSVVQGGMLPHAVQGKVWDRPRHGGVGGDQLRL